VAVRPRSKRHFKARRRIWYHLRDRTTLKTILVLSGGSESDSPVFETALAAAQPLGAHLRFVHIRIGSGQAAIRHAERSVLLLH
jgi:hypothetical protein